MPPLCLGEGKRKCIMVVVAGNTSLKTICASTGKHLVDTDDVLGMETNADVEVILANAVDHMLVSGNTTSLKRL